MVQNQTSPYGLYNSGKNLCITYYFLLCNAIWLRYKKKCKKNQLYIKKLIPLTGREILEHLYYISILKNYDGWIFIAYWSIIKNDYLYTLSKINVFKCSLQISNLNSSLIQSEMVGQFHIQPFQKAVVRMIMVCATAIHIHLNTSHRTTVLSVGVSKDLLQNCFLHLIKRH